MTAHPSSRSKSSEPYQPYRLELVQETPNSLTFKQGSLARWRSVRKAWVDLLEAMVFFLLPVATFFSPVPLYVREHWSLSLPSAPAAYYWIAIVLLAIPLFYTALIKPCFVLWTVDCRRKQIIRSVTNGVGMELQTFFDFHEVIAVDVLQRYVPNGRENSYCWLILDSGHKVFFSAAKTNVDKRSKAIVLKHHLVMAEKMRDALQIYTPPAIRSSRLNIPPADRPEAPVTLKSIWASITPHKQQRQERIAHMRRQVAADPQNGQAWEDLAFALSLSLDDSIRQEVVEAYRKAEALYRKAGNMKRAEFVSRMLRKLGSDLP
jgi:hypothetical protein